MPPPHGPRAPAGSWERRLPRDHAAGTGGSRAPCTADSSHQDTNFPGGPARSAPAPASFVCIPALRGPRSGARPRAAGPESTLRRSGPLPSFFPSFLAPRKPRASSSLPPGSASLAGGLFPKVREARPASCWEPRRRRRRAGVGRQGAGGARGQRRRPL